jgi:hypothetical protein
VGQLLPGEPAEVLQGLFERKPEDVPTDFDLLHGAMHKFLFYSGAWSRQNVPMCNFLLLESDLVPRQLDCDCEQNAKPGQLGTEKD